MTNIQESVDYFGNSDNIGVFKISASEESNIKSAFVEQSQIDTPVLEPIRSILLVNEHQQIFKQNALEYDVWLTRAIIFVLEDRQILFEKDYVPFSEEIINRRGYDLASTVSSEDEFLEGWNESITTNCTREIVKII